MESSVYGVSLHHHHQSPLFWPKGVENLVAGAGLMLSGRVVWDERDGRDRLLFSGGVGGGRGK